MRFDEIDLQPVIADDVAAASPPPASSPSIVRRLAALLIDLSLFVALGLVLSPLLPAAMGVIPVASLAGFVIIVAFYYFAGTRALWGKTIGGAIFDVRAVKRNAGAISR